MQLLDSKRTTSQTLWWFLLIFVSFAFGGVLLKLTIPAALLLGPLLAGLVIVACGGQIKVAPRAFELSQGVIACMIAGMIPRLGTGSGNNYGWMLFALGAGGVIVASGALGWLMTRLQILPGSTAMWGVSPGAATAMTLMAEASGADPELVAFMQYLRVVLVAAISSIVLKFLGGGAHAGTIVHQSWLAPIAWKSFAETMALAIIGPLLARRMQISAGALMGPLIAGILLSHAGLMTIETPRWLLVAAYAVFGWRIGLRFTKKLLLHVAKLLPRVVACTMALIVVCMLLAFLLVRIFHIDPLTAYLATSPGGADAIAIIASASNVDLHLVMTMQMLRVVATLVLGRTLARLVTQNAQGGQSAAPAPSTKL
jgi:membrane AbrB-like protein